ncbi:MAG: HesA/MoeB/ThiF family protein [Candidatus Woesearchaeota archaeon]
MDRYLRQRVYKNIGNKQELIRKTSVCIIGLGALGSVCADLLTRAGIGKLYLFDYEKVELINLQRQFYDEKDVGKFKIYATKKRLKKINSDVEIFAYNKRINEKNLDLIEKTKAGIILVCTDDMATRFLLNEYCIYKKKVFITGLVSGSKGYLMKVDNRFRSKKIKEHKDFPCFNCVFKKESCFNCQNQGILNSLSVMISGLIVNETIKSIVIDKEKRENFVLLSFEIWNNEFDRINVKSKCELHSKN